ncbi:MAG: hypothetical protein DI537_13715 [Stutzerimonas stutzeri]|nr:MAG: hypothetical protein DI537_13715 [Stutzerimonas stutzeri]
MANRILINPNGMRISAPGIDVFTAGPHELLFNSDWGGITVGASGQYWIGGFGDYYIGLPRAFPTNALIMIEASGFMLGGCRTVSMARDSYLGFGSMTSYWRASLVNSTTLLIRHSDYPNSGSFPPGTFKAAGPSFPYVANYAVLDA